MTVSSESGVAVITGASTGIGAATARELAHRGFHVLAGVRRERDADALRADGIEPVILDITQPEHIAELTRRVDAQAGPLRALVNNAAIQINAPVETLPLSEWRRQFEVNLFGHVAVTQALLPALLRESGRVVNISSVGGRVALPAYGPYAGTKFALEAVSDSLRRELAPLGVRVVVVEPGAVRTQMPDRVIAATNQQAGTMSPEQRDRYGRLLEAVNTHAAAHLPNGRPAEDAARVIAKAVTARKPRTRYTVGRDAALITRLSRVVPDRMLDRVLAASLRPHYPEPAAAIKAASPRRG
ncbi:MULTISPECIES: SDR family oxidoreductase [Amycolatopsis]|uniref:Short-chain dehydrogenase n=1 Tax=Amycolatopsis rubida TaxID=112413 RepID=A0A1I5F7R6_9PSEU|nr:MULTISPECIES: SDR family oxidoreductase [Amycolatopsis]OAP27060.1 putative oxidoreductase [Amycolatopsis sp. M39]SFO19782.1 Short-chain dehydrogenase [Amycolatopsis rubida]